MPVWKMKNIVLLIVKYLRDQVQSGSLTPDAMEGIEVAIQCIEAAFQISEEELQACNESLLDIYNRHKLQSGPKPVTNEQREEAENLKLVGNTLMKENRFEEAIANYSRAIELDPNNAVYYCNRAAANIKITAYAAAIEDCYQALRIDPRYSKAHSRLGFAYSATGYNTQAKSCYQKALEIEPDNESYRASLQNIEEQLASSSSAPYSELAGLLPGIDLSGLLRNPGFVNMAGQMLADPGMQSVVSRLLSSQQFPLGNVEDLISVGQQLADRLQQGTGVSATNGGNNAQNAPRQADGQNGFPDLIRPQDGEAAPASQGQSIDPQQQEIRPDVVQQAVEDLPPGVNPVLPENRNLGTLDLAPPSTRSTGPPVDTGPRGDSSLVQGDVVNQVNAGNTDHLRH